MTDFIPSTTEIDCSNICSDLCFATDDELRQYEEEQAIVAASKLPKIKPLMMGNVPTHMLPRKEDPWKNQPQRKISLPKNTTLPKTTLPWAKK